MKKMFFLLVALVIFTCANSFGYILVPKDSISSFVSETAQKNNIKNPDLIFPSQEILIYLGSYVKIPVLITVQKGDNLTRIIRNVIKEMSPLERDNRNLTYDLLRDQDRLMSSSTSSQSKQKDLKTPPIEVRWSIAGLILFTLLVVIGTYLSRKYK